MADMDWAKALMGPDSGEGTESLPGMDEESEDSSDAYMPLAENILDAMKAGDAAELADALKAFVEMCSEK